MLSAMSASSSKRPATVLNFALVGEVRSGAAVVQGVINQLGEAVCHLNLFNPSEAIRRASHEEYFGPTRDPARLPEWFTPETNPNRYLANQVFDNPLHDERVIGVRTPYAAVRQYELYDLFKQRTHEGDFCVVHVLRNPIACFVSKKQAEKTQRWFVGGGEPLSHVRPSAIRLDSAELTAFVWDWESTRAKVQASSEDQLLVRYKDLTLHFESEMQRVFEFLDLSPRRIPRPNIRRLRNRSMQERIINYDELLKSGPSIVRQHLAAEDLF